MSRVVEQEYMVQLAHGPIPGSIGDQNEGRRLHDRIELLLNDGFSKGYALERLVPLQSAHGERVLVIQRRIPLALS